MTREIKFKAKRKYNNKWVYGYIFKDINKTAQMLFNSKNGDIEFVDILPKTICEYTGLKDKNGVEIYENDIVKNDEFTLTVVYNPRETKFALMDKETFIDQCSDTLSDCDDIEETFVDDKYFEYSCGSYEVIGNVYDKEVK